MSAAGVPLMLREVCSSIFRAKQRSDILNVNHGTMPTAEWKFPIKSKIKEDQEIAISISVTNIIDSCGSVLCVPTSDSSINSEIDQLWALIPGCTHPCTKSRRL